VTGDAYGVAPTGRSWKSAAAPRPVRRAASARDAYGTALTDGGSHRRPAATDDAYGGGRE
jgi:hypothetical protein